MHKIKYRLRATSDKAKAIQKAKASGRKVIWKDRDGKWHYATDRRNTPGALWAVETEDVN